MASKKPVTKALGGKQKRPVERPGLTEDEIEEVKICLKLIFARFVKLLTYLIPTEVVKLTPESSKLPCNRSDLRAKVNLEKNIFRSHDLLNDCRSRK